MVTDGCLGLTGSALQKKIKPGGVLKLPGGGGQHGGSGGSNMEDFPLPFPFPSKLHVCLLADPNAKSTKIASNFYQQLVDVNGGDGGVHLPEDHLTLKVTRTHSYPVLKTEI